MARDSSALDPTSLLAHGDFVTALARGLVADPNRADDVVQDTWLAALSNPPRDASRLRAWLAAVTRNFARQSSRREERTVGREKLAARAEATRSTAELCEREAMRREVVGALLELSEPQRAALLLRFYEGLPPREIARRLRVPVETVRTRIKRGLAELRVRLDQRHGGSRDAWSAALLAWLDIARAPVSGSVFAIPVVAAACLALVVWISIRPAQQTDTQSLAVSTSAPAAGAPDLPKEETSPPARVAAAPQTQSKAAAEPPAPRPIEAQIDVRERTLSGRVMDASDAPIAGALVYVGNQIRARGDEPFKPFKADRIKDGVQTDAAGQFTLTGSGRWITAWHADYGALTVAWADAARIVLPSQATLHGRLVDALEQPLAGRTIMIDRERETVTAADGRFTFDRVEIGVRGLQVIDAVSVTDAATGLRSRPKGPWFGARFDGSAGEPITLVLDSPAVRIALKSKGEPFERTLECVPIGTGRVFGTTPKEVKGSASLEFAGVMPGAYLLLSRTGQLAPLELARGTTSYELDLGAAELTVRAPAKTRVYVVPAGSDEFVQLMAGRVASQTVPDTGEIKIAPLPAGRYDVGIDSQGILVTVKVENGGSVVELK